VTRGDSVRSVRVLIVEDDRRVRTALRAFLSASSGFEVVAGAGSAAAALDLARERAPAVALVDIHLPDLQEGLDLLTTLTCELRIPTVAISIESSMRARALAAGADQFLEKAGVPEHLLTALHAAIAAHDNHRAGDS
jgi:DNA-binding NarL/FixJ family response regulator